MLFRTVTQFTENQVPFPQRGQCVRFILLRWIWKADHREEGTGLGWNPASNSEGTEDFFVREVQGRGGPLYGLSR